MTKVLIALLLVSAFAVAEDSPAVPSPTAPVITQSHPAWWMYAPPEATALVGIQWSYLRSSALAQPIAAELSTQGSLGLPDFDFLRNSQQVLIASPSMMVIASGSFPAAVVRSMALAKGFKASGYKGIELWVTPDKDTMSIARISDQVILFAHIPVIKDAIDRSTQKVSRRNYSDLLSAASRYAKQDLWVVTGHFPDPLASLFVPFDVQGRSFEGGLSVWDGLHATAAIETTSGAAAEETADALWTSISALPVMADGTQISTDGRTVLLTVDIDEQQFQSSLRGMPQAPEVITAAEPSAGPKPQPVIAAAKAPETSAAAKKAAQVPALAHEKKVDATKTAAATSAAVKPAAPATMATSTPLPVSASNSLAPNPEPEKPKARMMVRILGLADGPIEIPLPAGNP